jgi:tetratricopeptide (TPR) repeat protein
MGSVWLAWSKQAKGHCAIKVLDLRKDRRGSSERSFNREVRAMARLDHPSIAAVYDFGRTEKGSPFLAMEYAEGESLHALMRQPWTWPTLWLLLDALLAALGHAHARGLVHRDLKPGNVLIRSGSTQLDAVKLVDFGIALNVPDAASASRRIEGTPAYIAPEAAAGDVAAVGPWTDLYSLGVMLFELLTGDLPYHGRHLLAHHQRSPVPTIEIRNSVDVPPGIVPVVERLLAKAPYQRFRSVADVRDALIRLGPPAKVEPFPEPARSVLLELDDDRTIALKPMDGPAGVGLIHLRNPPVVGRGAAQRQLEEAAEAALAGLGPRVVVIEAEAGYGKSTLAGWLREQVEETGVMRTLLVPSEPQTRAGGLRDAILRFIGAPTLTREQAPSVFREVFSDRRNQHNALGVLWPEPGTESGAMRIKRAAWMMRDLAQDRPFMLWADDAHWSPEGRVMKLVHRLARPDGARHMLLVVTMRPTERHSVNAALRSMLVSRRASIIKLGAINPLELGPALNTLAPLPPGIAEAAAMASAGNPFYALQAVRGHLEDEGLGSAPADPADLLAKRIARATKGEHGCALRSTLVRATLLGRSFTLRPLARLCRVPGDPLAPDLVGTAEQTTALLELAVNAGLAIEQSPGRWRFGHDLIRAQLRNMCRTLPNWPDLNLAAAALKGTRAGKDHTGIELEVVARHHWEGGEHGTALALGLDGIRRLHSAGLMGHTTSFVRRLIEWDDQVNQLSAEDRCELRLLGSEAAEHAGQPFLAHRHAEVAVSIARHNLLQGLGARAASRLGMVKLHADDQEGAESCLWDAVRFARNSQDPRARSEANLSLGDFYQHRDQYGLARTAYESALEQARDADICGPALAARSALGRLDRLEGSLDRAFDTFRAVAELAREEGWEVLALEARLQQGFCAWAAEDAEEAADAFEDVMDGARGNLFVHEFQAALGAAWAHAAQRHWTDCELCLMQAEDLRFDVRLSDPETELLRLQLRRMATESRRPDILIRVDRLDIVATRTQSTHSGDPLSTA